MAAFAFLLASVVVQSADIWWHLAEGRRLLSSADFWDRSPGGPAQASGLYDIGTYLAWLASPTAGVVVAHAALAAVAAVVAFGGRQAARGLVPLAVAAVAVLATGSQPATTPAAVSLLLVAVAGRMAGSARVERGGWRAVLPLAVLLVIWTNTNGWSLLGVAVVGATLVGRALDAPLAKRPRLLRFALGTTALLAAVCLLNPLHIRALQWPADLGRLGSPLAAAFRDGPGRLPTGLAFYSLLGLGLLSLLLDRSGRRWERLLPLVLVAALASADAGAIPLFAIVGGPLVARIVTEFLARRNPNRPPRRRSRMAAQALAGVLGAAFLVAAWPGWLQAPPYAPRGWAVDPPESLTLAANTTAEWFATDSLPPDARVLHVSVESARAFAWHAPNVRNLVDEELSRALLSTEAAPAEQLDKARVRVVVASNPPSGPSVGPFIQRCLDDDRWQLLAIRGRVWVLGWRGESFTADPFERILSGRAATGAGAEAIETLSDSVDPPPRHWTDPFTRHPPRQTTDRDRAAGILLLADAQLAAAARAHADEWKAVQFAGLALSAAAWTPAAPAELFLRLTEARTRLPDPADPGHLLARALAPAQRRFARGRDDASLPLLYAAVRAARKAVAAAPNDATAHYVLGECYSRLLRNTREREWVLRFPEFGDFRRVQLATALTRAVSLDPTLAAAHAKLADTYFDDGAFDLALAHLERFAELSGGTPTALDRLREDVATREAEYAAGADKLRVADRAESAVRLGLIGRGLAVLKESDVAAFGGVGAELQLKLMLRTGGAAEVRDWDLGDTVKLFDPVAFRWLRVQSLAGTGRYAEAARETGGIATGTGLLAPSAQRKVAAFVGRFALDRVSAWDGVPALVQQSVTEAEANTAFRLAVAEHRTMLSRDLILGLLAFEAGDLPNAKAAFQSVLDSSPETGLVPPSPHRGIARQMLYLIPRPAGGG